MKKYIIILSFFLMTSCASLLVREYKFPLKDLSGVKQVNILINCDNRLSRNLPMTICEAGIKNGSYYCKDVQTYHCRKGERLLVTGFTADSFPQLRSYVEYLIERFDQVGRFQ